MKLVRPSVRYHDSYLASLEELDHRPDVVACDTELARTDFERFVTELTGRADGMYLPDGFVPESVFWLVEHDEYIGRVSVRHYLTEHLRQVGGHVGYHIRPSRRGMGYGTQILALVLPKAKELGIDRLLVTCDATNIASRKIIEKNGGILESQLPNPAGGPDKLHFWIKLR